MPIDWSNLLRAAEAEARTKSICVMGGCGSI
jgi:hypothetical protein